jgi:hypothetical protein
MYWESVGGAVGVGGAEPWTIPPRTAGSAPWFNPSPNYGACTILGSWQTHSLPWNFQSTDAVITFYQDGTLSGVPEFKGRWSLVGTAFTIIETSGPDMNCDQEDHWTLTFSPDCRTAPLLPTGSGCTGARRYLDWDVTLTRVASVGGAGGSTGVGGAFGAGGNAGDGGPAPDVLAAPDAASGSCPGWCTCPAGDYGIELNVNDGPTVFLRAGTTGGDSGGSGVFGGCFEPIAFVGDDRQVMGVGACFATTGKPPCFWLYSDGTGQYMDEQGAVRPLVNGVFTSSATVSSCSSARSGEFKVWAGPDTDGGPQLLIGGRFRACPEGPLVL